jgi:hypothetical protein
MKTLNFILGVVPPTIEGSKAMGRNCPTGLALEVLVALLFASLKYTSINPITKGI